MPSVSIITPTIGRSSLEKVLGVLVPQLSDGDEILVGGDGPQPESERIVSGFANSKVIYWEHPLTRNFGNPQRNEGIRRANGDFIVFIDDDDIPKEDCIEKVKRGVVTALNAPHLFRMSLSKDQILPAVRRVQCGNVSGQMFVPPNVKEKLGKWGGTYSADFGFISSTLSLYPPDSLVWHDEIICQIGWAGPEAAGGREIL